MTLRHRQQQRSLTPERSGGDQRDSSTKAIGLFGHVARLPAVVPASAALSIARTASDGVSPA